MADSPRWCATHNSYGDHHTDRCPETYGRLTVEERETQAMREQMLRSGFVPKAAPRTRFPLGSVLSAVALAICVMSEQWALMLAVGLVLSYCVHAEVVKPRR